MAPSVEGGVSLSHLTLHPLCLHRRISHSPSLHPASSAATQWQPGVRHPESGELRQHGDQRLHRQLRLYPRKVRGWLCFHGNTQVCPISEKGHCRFLPVTTCFLTCLLTCLWGTLTVATPARSSFHLSCEVKFTDVNDCVSLSCCFQCLVSRHVCLLFCHHMLLDSVCCSACGLEAQRIEEMEKMLRDAQQEKARLIENRVSSQLLAPTLKKRLHF